MTNKGNRNRGKGFFQQQRPSFPFNIKQKFPYAVTLSVKQITACIHIDTNVPPSRHDMSLALCPLEIPGDFNPTPVSKPISKYTHRPAHGEHMQTHRHSPLCHSLSLSPARLFSHHRHSPFPIISVPSLSCFSLSQVFLFPVFLSIFPTFKDKYGHIWKLIHVHIVVLKTNNLYYCPCLNMCPYFSKSKVVGMVINKLFTAGY